MIEFKNVTKTYANGVKGLNNISIDIQDGEFVSIIGLSGAGKSTFLRSINRLNDISEGEIIIDGKSLTKANKKELKLIRRNIGMIFQHFNLVKKMTVQKNVISGRLGYYSTMKSIFGVFSKEDYQLVNESLELVGLSDKLHSRCDELSGGQQQRVSIARTLVQNSSIILADEPVASLDPITTERIMDDLKRINNEYNRTIIINLHSVELARKYSTRIIGLRNGEVVFDGAAAEATDEVLKNIYGEKILEEADGVLV
ncbi:phosphonate ABC transporter ATP-binding protein [Vagococcus bubulae]|uniref:Phosphonate ABC transporter ATP-binding protein n=1 Tax=Vagococcus bubulae TaxID=1977868 RepID=A0A429ZPW8_9ENTE|nr:phosphonate ABC transporter ATP-binding protein [Vagococcus bubulae]RST95679.1 phosphonate ABC transporter ATP-binding protein [Vagococcus bubulae]